MRTRYVLLTIAAAVAAAGLLLVVIFFASAIFAPWIAPYDPNAMDIPARMSGPTLAHIAGTDQLGRDIPAANVFRDCRSHVGRDTCRGRLLHGGCVVGLDRHTP